MTYANEKNSLTKDNISTLNELELLDELFDNGLHLPEDYSSHREMAAQFVYKYTPLIIQGKIEALALPFNYDQSNELLLGLEGILREKGLCNESVASVQATYTLQDSTMIGSWDASYVKYNCYAYSLGKRDKFLQPGQMSGRSFSLSMSISQMANVVLADLATEGYWGYTLTAKPNSLPDQYFKVIAMRKANNGADYHFMRPFSVSVNEWSHKPGGTLPLKWKYSSPGQKVWTNESSIKGVSYAPTVTYNSSIYYIVYKHKSSPGIQPTSMDFKSEQA